MYNATGIFCLTVSRVKDSNGKPGACAGPVRDGLRGLGMNSLTPLLPAEGTPGKKNQDVRIKS
jgi:hypothetical protein